MKSAGNADGKGKHELLSDPQFLDFSPSYSPDGSRIAFERCRAAFDACALYSIDLTGGDLTQITPFDVANEILDAAPKYSPNGNRIAYDWDLDDGTANVAIVDTDGSNRHLIQRDAFLPVWQPVG